MASHGFERIKQISREIWIVLLLRDGFQLLCPTGDYHEVTNEAWSQTGLTVGQSSALLIVDEIR